MDKKVNIAHFMDGYIDGLLKAEMDVSPESFNVAFGMAIALGMDRVLSPTNIRPERAALLRKIFVGDNMMIVWNGRAVLVDSKTGIVTWITLPEDPRLRKITIWQLEAEKFSKHAMDALHEMVGCDSPTDIQAERFSNIEWSQEMAAVYSALAREEAVGE